MRKQAQSKGRFVRERRRKDASTHVAGAPAAPFTLAGPTRGSAPAIVPRERALGQVRISPAKVWHFLAYASACLLHDCAAAEAPAGIRILEYPGQGRIAGCGVRR